jgi:glycosyltransferase involved in cell wall biosynthesis
VIATTYNHGRFVEQCLDAIAAQTSRDFELVIMDDCSTDGSVAAIRSWLERTGFPAQLIVNEQNRGICATRNIALAHCAGEFISSVAGDDYFEPEKLEHQYAFFQSLAPSVAVVFSNTTVVDEAGRALRSSYAVNDEVVDGQIFDRLMRSNYIPAPSVMIRRRALDDIGGYDEQLAFEDYDIWLRLADRYEFRYLAESLANYRIVSNSISRDPRRTPAITYSKALALLKWVGRSAELDDRIQRRVWTMGRRMLLIDWERGRSMLESAYRVHPAASRRMLLLVARLPISRLPVRQAWIQSGFAMRDRYKAARQARNRAHRKGR